jgi:hypothetical protein
VAIAKRSRSKTDLRLRLLRQGAKPQSVGGLYAAKLLFEFCVSANGKPHARRLCEERIILVEASSAFDAARVAQRQGKTGQTRYRNLHGERVRLRFVGVLELVQLDTGREPNEVWWVLTTRLRPMERRAQIVPRVRDLAADIDERRRAARG